MDIKFGCFIFNYYICIKILNYDKIRKTIIHIISVDNSMKKPLLSVVLVFVIIINSCSQDDLYERYWINILKTKQEDSRLGKALRYIDINATERWGKNYKRIVITRDEQLTSLIEFLDLTTVNEGYYFDICVEARNKWMVSNDPCNCDWIMVLFTARERIKSFNKI